MLKLYLLWLKNKTTTCKKEKTLLTQKIGKFSYHNLMEYHFYTALLKIAE